MSEAAGTFRVAGSRYAAVEARRWFGRTGWLAAAAVAALLVCSAYDSRFAYVALMLVFVVYPMIMTLAWFSIVARPDMVRRQSLQSWSIEDNDRLAIRYYNDEGAQTGTESILLDNVVSFENGASFLILRLNRKSGAGVLIVPAQFIPDGLIDRLNQLDKTK